MNLWHDLPPGPDVPNTIYVIVEIPKGSRNKYEYHKTAGVIKLDRVLYSSLMYPGDYGLIPRTYYEDGDPLDVLVMNNESTFPGCVIEARPIGIFRMMDRGLPDDKILAVPSTDPLFDGYKDISDIPPHYLKEVQHFFEVYKDLEASRTEAIGWEDADVARAQIEHAVDLYHRQFQPPKL
ncbi:MAG: inorganic diphosphatase [Chloroflexota bacterium]